MSIENTSVVKVRLIAGGLLILVIIAINSYCTQFVASRLAYHTSLGEPLFGNYYSPFAWWGWAANFREYAPTTYNYAALIFLGGVFISLFVYKAIIGFVTRSSRKHPDTHGTAHFATLDEVKASGLMNQKEGVYVSGYVNPKTGRTHYLRHNGPEHICLIAPTGAGKGVGNVIPTMLSEPESVFILDRKGEIYAMTAGWRKKHANNIVLRFDPAQEFGSCAWNPLEEIRFGTRYQVSDAQNIALMVIDDDGKGIQGNHFRSAAYEMLVGLILHALYKAEAVGRQPSLQDCAHMITGVGDFAAPEPEDLVDDGESRAFTWLFDEMRNVALDESQTAEVEAQLAIRSAGTRFGDTPSRELGSIISTANNALSLYRDPVVGGNTSRSDFKIADLMDHMENGKPKPVSLYFITTPRNADRMRPLARLLLTQMVLSLCDMMEFDKGRSKTEHKSRLLLMLDEFATLGKLDVFQGALAFIRGYGIKAVIVIQDVQQLYQLYTNHESIISNCQVRIAYAPNKLETAEWLSKMVGQTTVVNEQISTSGKRFNSVATNYSRSLQSVQRPLMTSDEVMRLPKATKVNGNITAPAEMLIFDGGPVIRGSQILYFNDPTFSKRSMIEPPKESDVVRSVP
jgi:type IV secretion system protein VirD4